ncbi:MULTISPECIES: preprotein translocase subunit YajC [Streptococcus]|uniref:Preprotein translocase subunit YajC n=1 Tax=Streptococcus suis TaxID=1307 RepID=A0A9X4MXS4_STRSU|nr:MULTISPECIES: preprotein translocase subunit YajC [Streptococcus]MBY4956307.1 preprotein translocase subunit YajC [Streptococcus suis]MBY4971222.1 preprotein translocase subunit YajC [Streptococcus suis]MBY4981117.1 preprotein translocase subunit YajC [Streptococcus suis]MBY4991895.1 preprotein translocase subunit YajC [Streptococcus suis]MBY5007225.1 preprotein translocase subunit YajC [Streptococcus suis]
MEGLFLPLVMVAMIGFMFYSQRKQQKQRQEALNQIKKGDEIVTIGGLFGIVDEIDDKKVVLDVDGVYLTFERGAIRNRVASSGTTSAVVEEVAVETPEATPESAIEE